MCISKLSQLIYGVIALCIIALTIGSMFTPGWRTIKAEVEKGEHTGEIIKETINKGIFPFSCALSFDESGKVINKADMLDSCKQWWEDQPGYEKVVIALMIIAALVSILALAWNILTFFCCFGRGGIFRPLPSLAATATVCLLVALIVFYANNEKDIEIIKKWKGVKKVDQLNDVSYSFFLAMAATVLSFVNIILGSLVVQSAEKCL